MVRKIEGFIKRVPKSIANDMCDMLGDSPKFWKILEAAQTQETTCQELGNSIFCLIDDLNEEFQIVRKEERETLPECMAV